MICGCRKDFVALLSRRAFLVTLSLDVYIVTRVFIDRFHVIYSGLQKHCNVLQFQIVCSVALYGMEITLSIIERK
jgi:hypothetical protein